MDLDGLRGKICEKDYEIIRLISERTAIAEEIGKIKIQSGLDIQNKAVEEKVISRYISEGQKYGLSEEDMRSLAEIMIKIAVRAEEEVQKNTESKNI